MTTGGPGAEPPHAEALHAEALAAGGLEWLLGAARAEGPGLAWAGTAGSGEFDPSLYSGGAGIVITLLAAHRHFRDDRYADAALRGSRAIAAAVDDWDISSLYFGLTGMAFALRAVGRLLADTASDRAADHALEVVRSRFDGSGGPTSSNCWAATPASPGRPRRRDPGLAVLAVTPYLRTSEPTAGGVHWEVRSGTPARFHHLSHGTLGIVLALAAVGEATGRPGLTGLALAGAADVVSRNEAGPSGFLVPHSDPQHKPERIERYSFGYGVRGPVSGMRAAAGR